MSTAKAEPVRTVSGTRGASLLKRIRVNWMLYLFLIPCLVYAAIFWYAPMAGLVMSFKRYNPMQGMFGSPWVGLEHFRRFFDSYMFGTILKNTLFLSIYSFLAGMPIPVLLAIAFQYCRSSRASKTVQTIAYAPYFISVVVLVAMLMVFLSPRTGLINIVMRDYLGGTPINFMTEEKYFRHLYVWSGVWQNAGWNSIIYTAALAGSEVQLHEAAVIDGASKWRRVWAIDIPVLIPTFVILQIMNIGSIMSVGFEKVYLMQNSANIMVSEIISTYTYTLGIKGGEISYTTAIGLFNNIINFVLLMAANFISGKATKISVV
ncbi:ABC transporter permease subunit [Ruminococcaceae bacterium OttesenSCG-928-L11]|nr:ABC transporter permease subunit [Ruminococcaceae bacterium OttesenSCG-928-L11]